jgi:hypothetical protein
MSGQVQLRLEPASGRFNPQDDRWLAQVTGLVTELRDRLRDAAGDGGVTAPATPQPGTKGAAGAIVLSLASAGTLTAAVELLRSWLGRDRTRSVKVSWTAEGDLQSVELHGDGLDDAPFDELLHAVAKRVAGGG